MFNQEVHAVLILNSIDELGPARFQSLIQTFGSANQALSAGFKSWGGIPLFNQTILKSIEKNFSLTQKRAEEDQKLIHKCNVKLHLSHMDTYPKLLKEIAHPPPVLYVQGENITSEQLAVALVGSRACSYYGEKMAWELSSGLAVAGITTVSGLARGIDTHVHKATLEAGGKTWAIIGSGLNRIYPPENRLLAEKIMTSGALISEFPMNTQPFPGNFPRRNRIIAGLTKGTVVIEGGEKSGSLITARLAAEEGRDVFAVPGPVTSSQSYAPNRLLQSGAIMVQSVSDILNGIGITPEFMADNRRKQTDVSALPKIYKQVLNYLGGEPTPKEILAQKLKTGVGELSSLLLEMEIKGLIRSGAGGNVFKT
ncbi:MAG: hypothetical protein KCHDKBKB_00988 [Elusimicrobia bacterium]|nr:hypothetical protein [Elusimicrobiota bacterium]